MAAHAVQASCTTRRGAYPGGNAGSGAFCMLSPYDIPCGLVEGYDVVVNKPKTGPYRAPARRRAPSPWRACWDELAGKLGLDPIELRVAQLRPRGHGAP